MMHKSLIKFITKIQKNLKCILNCLMTAFCNYEFSIYTSTIMPYIIYRINNHAWNNPKTKNNNALQLEWIKCKKPNYINYRR